MPDPCLSVVMVFLYLCWLSSVLHLSPSLAMGPGHTGETNMCRAIMVHSNLHAAARTMTLGTITLLCSQATLSSFAFCNVRAAEPRSCPGAQSSPAVPQGANEFPCGG